MLFFGQCWAAEAGTIEDPITVGNQSAVPRPDGNFTIYNVPVGINRTSRSGAGETVKILFPYAAVTTGSRTDIFTMLEYYLNLAPNAWSSGPDLSVGLSMPGINRITSYGTSIPLKVTTSQYIQMIDGNSRREILRHMN